MHEGDKYGEAVFDVFPRKGALFPAVRQKTPSTKDSKELYHFETNVTLSQVLEDEGFSASCGVIRAAVTLKQEEPEKEGISKLVSSNLRCSTCVCCFFIIKPLPVSVCTCMQLMGHASSQEHFSNQFLKLPPRNVFLSFQCCRHPTKQAMQRTKK